MNILKKIFAAAALMLTAGAVAGNLSAQDSTAAVREAAPRHWDFTLEDVIVMAQSKSLPALVARYSFISSYWQFRSYRAGPTSGSTTAPSWPCRTPRPARPTTSRTTT